MTTETQEPKCADCDVAKPMRYFRPLKEGEALPVPESRDMLCEHCWRRAYKRRYPLREEPAS